MQQDYEKSRGGSGGGGANDVTHGEPFLQYLQWKRLVEQASVMDSLRQQQQLEQLQREENAKRAMAAEEEKEAARLQVAQDAFEGSAEDEARLVAESEALLKSQRQSSPSRVPPLVLPPREEDEANVASAQEGDPEDSNGDDDDDGEIVSGRSFDGGDGGKP